MPPLPCPLGAPRRADRCAPSPGSRPDGKQRCRGARGESGQDPRGARGDSRGRAALPPRRACSMPPTPRAGFPRRAAPAPPAPRPRPGPLGAGPLDGRRPRRTRLAAAAPGRHPAGNPAVSRGRCPGGLLGGGSLVSGLRGAGGGGQPGRGGGPRSPARRPGRWRGARGQGTPRERQPLCVPGRLLRPRFAPAPRAGREHRHRVSVGSCASVLGSAGWLAVRGPALRSAGTGREGPARVPAPQGPAPCWCQTLVGRKPLKSRRGSEPSGAGGTSSCSPRAQQIIGAARVGQAAADLSPHRGSSASGRAQTL